MANVDDWGIEFQQEADRILNRLLENKKKIETSKEEISQLEVKLKGQINLSTLLGGIEIAKDESLPHENVTQDDSANKEFKALEREWKLKKEALVQLQSDSQLEYERSCSDLVNKKFEADKPRLSNLSAETRNWLKQTSFVWFVAASIMTFVFLPVGIGMFIAAGTAALAALIGSAIYGVYRSLTARRDEIALELKEYIDESVEFAESFSDSDALSEEYSEELENTERSDSALEITVSPEVVNAKSPVEDKHSETHLFKKLWEEFKPKPQPQFDPFDYSEFDAKRSKKAEEALAQAVQALEHSIEVVKDDKRELERAENAHKRNIAELELDETPENKALAYRSEKHVDLCEEIGALAALKFHYKEDYYKILSRDGGMSHEREAELEQLTNSMEEQFSEAKERIKAAKSKCEDADLKLKAVFAEPGTSDDSNEISPKV